MLINEVSLDEIYEIIRLREDAIEAKEYEMFLFSGVAVN